jgi:hypothetical protein
MQDLKGGTICAERTAIVKAVVRVGSIPYVLSADIAAERGNQVVYRSGRCNVWFFYPVNALHSFNPFKRRTVLDIALWNVSPSDSRVLCTRYAYFTCAG